MILRISTVFPDTVQHEAVSPRDGDIIRQVSGKK